MENKIKTMENQLQFLKYCSPSVSLTDLGTLTAWMFKNLTDEQYAAKVRDALECGLFDHPTRITNVCNSIFNPEIVCTSVV